jgi:hypothetical protein
MLNSSLNSAKTIDLLLQNIQQLNQINESLQTRLQTQFLPDSSSSSIRKSRKNQHTRENLSTAVDLDSNSSDIESIMDFDDDMGEDFDDYLISQEDSCVVPGSQVKNDGNLKDLDNLPENKPKNKQNNLVKDISLPKTRAKAIPKRQIKPKPKPQTSEEIFTEILKDSKDLFDIDNHPKRSSVLPYNFSAVVKKEFSIQIFERYGIFPKTTNFICDIFQLTEQDIADLINELESSKFSRNDLQLLGDQLVQQIIAKTKSSRFALNDVIRIGEQKINYDLAIRNYLKNLFISKEYAQALSVLAQLKEISPHLDEDYLILKMKILLNLRNYIKLEDMIEKEKILSRSWKDDLILFLTFRTYYEQHKYDEIYGEKSPFPEKLKELAHADYQILNDYDTILTPRKVHKILTNLIPEFHACKPVRDEMIQFYLEKLQEYQVTYYFFAIHFVNWVKNYEQNDPRILKLLQTWRNGAKMNPMIIGTYLTLTEEILSELISMDSPINLQKDFDDVNKELRGIQQIRTASKI